MSDMLIFSYSDAVFSKMGKDINLKFKYFEVKPLFYKSKNQAFEILIGCQNILHFFKKVNFLKKENLIKLFS